MREIEREREREREREKRREKKRERESGGVRGEEQVCRRLRNRGFKRTQKRRCQNLDQQI